MASSSLSLTHRLQALADSYKQTLNLIQELQRFPSGALFTADPNPDEKRLEVANEIHQSLKEQEDSLEFLRQEVEDDDSRRDTHVLRRNNTSSVGGATRFEERERNAATLTRLNEDVKSARVAFRRAQLQAKRNADAAKRKEREDLFADRLHSPEQGPSLVRKEGPKKLTQDEIALNAAEDVTRSLRRAHELLSGNLQQSQFAQQTLEESQEALKGLAESYGGTTDLLKSSRGLVGQLVRSQKSDTWFLMSSLYLLVATIAWLIFRRLLYGPMWWLVWQPLKLMWYFTFASLGVVGLGGRRNAQADPASLARRDIPTNSPEVVFKSIPLPGKGGGWDAAAQPAQKQEPPAPVMSGPETPEMVDAVGRMAEAAAASSSSSSPPPPLKERDPAVSPTNPKKRQHEEEILRDEL